MNQDQLEIKRPGKTRREHRSGVHQRRFTNRAMRVAWQHDPNRTNKNFPLHACNGKKSRALKGE